MLKLYAFGIFHAKVWRMKFLSKKVLAIWLFAKVKILFSLSNLFLKSPKCCNVLIFNTQKFLPLTLYQI